MRILGLHGYQTSSKIFLLQSRYLRRKLDKDLDLFIEWVVPDAPNKSNDPISDIVRKIFEPPYFHWFVKDSSYLGLKESKDKIECLGEFDGIVGFSQGACLTYIMAKIIKPKFIINICGVNYQDCRSDKTLINIPTLNVIGSLDPLKNRSELLANDYVDPEFLYHPGNHSFPPDRESYNQISNFIKKFKN